MGTTIPHDFEYPEDSDLVVNGALAMRLLAQSLQLAFAPAGVDIAAGNVSTELTPADAGKVLTFTGAPTVAGQFDVAVIDNGTRVTYTGTRPRPFLITAAVTAEVLATLEEVGFPTVFHQLWLRNNTTVLDVSTVDLHLRVGVSGANDLIKLHTHTHRLSAVVTLHPGDIVSVVGRGQASGLIGARLSVHPVGPAVAA